MNEPEWTKGQWHLVANTIYALEDSMPRQSRFCASVLGKHCPAQELIANAKLMAAAPKLYHALHVASILLSALVRDNTDPIASAILQLAQEALSEALLSTAKTNVEGMNP